MHKQTFNRVVTPPIYWRANLQKISRLHTLFVAFAMMCATQLCAQISVKGYSLVYSSETPERAASLLSLSSEELANCTGDFTSTENLERNWSYSNKASSDWNKRMGTTAEERALVHKPQDGHLHMYAKTTDGTASGFITSGVNMKQGYKYGIFEVKAKCTPHASNFPAIWMMPVLQTDGWPNCGEIDIMEQIGTSSTVWSTVHVGARYDKPVGKSYSWSGSMSASTGWHIYSLLWTKTSLIFYCDGRQVFRYNKDATLDLANHPDYEKWQFPYNKEFYIILDQALGKNAWWGSENPDPSFTYEMDVEYVRIWQAPETYDVDNWYVMQNYAEPTRYMMGGEDNKLTSAEVSDPSQLKGNMVFGLAPTDNSGKYFLRSLTSTCVGYMADANKAVPLSEEAYAYFMLKDAEKGVAFDHGKNSAPFTFADGSRALTLNANRNYAVTISGTSKDAAWWILHDATDIVNGIDGVPVPTRETTPRKVVRQGRIVIETGDGKIYSLMGTRIR